MQWELCTQNVGALDDLQWITVLMTSHSELASLEKKIVFA